MAEIKAAYAEDFEEFVLDPKPVAKAKRVQQIPRISSPDWTPQMLQCLMDTEGDLENAQALSNSDCDPRALDTLPQQHATENRSGAGLLALFTDLELSISKSGKKRSVEEMLCDIQCLDSKSGEKAQIEASRKKPRGNHAFFLHLAHVRKNMTRLPDEPATEFERRVRAEAKETWSVNA